jgi:sigma-B regulation protein RsbU (phosphoserine phosphatase)
MNYHFIRESNRKLETTRRELVKSSRLVEAARNLNSTLDLDKLLDIILDMALQIVDGDRGTVYLLDDGVGELWTKVTRGLDGEGKGTIRLPLGKGIAGYVAATGDTINIPDAYMDPRFNPDFDRQTGYRTESILCTPMRNKDGHIIGVFQLLNKHRGTFTADDASFLDALSLHASLAIENARLYEQERQKIRIERDLLAAREVQTSLLPKDLPSIQGYDFAATTVPALEVAGDLYDFVPLDESRIAVSLGDVSGKGLPAALLMANIQATLRQQASAAGSPVECITRANRLLYQHTSPEKFVTLFYMFLDHRKHRFVFSNAGHEFPLLVSASGAVRRLETGGVVLGIVEEFPFEEETVALSRSDLLVVYSDGITEAPDKSGEQFGVRRLESLILENKDRPAEEILQAILAAVYAHAGGGAASDDRTLVILRRT